MIAEVVSQNDWFSWSLNQLSREFGIARETVGKRLSDADVKPSGLRRGHPVYRVGDAASAILVPRRQSFSGVVDPEETIEPGWHQLRTFYFRTVNWSPGDTVFFDIYQTTQSNSLRYSRYPDGDLTSWSYIPYWDGPVVIRDIVDCCGH